MYKLYRRRQDGSLEYREAWTNDGEVVEHWGVVGTRGQTRRHKAKTSNEEKALERVVTRIRADGFSEMPQDQHRCLLVEWRQDGPAPSEENDRPARMSRRLNDLLAWNGLGVCDGVSAGNGVLVACCLVVDFDVARKVIEADIAGTEYANVVRMVEDR